MKNDGIPDLHVFTSWILVADFYKTKLMGAIVPYPPSMSIINCPGNKT